MGNQIPEQNKKKTSYTGQNQNVEYITMQMKGWRQQMQDSIITQLSIDRVSQTSDGYSNSLFAVFDGHGTSYISRFLKQHFIQILTSQQSYLKKNYFQALQSTFKQLDQLMMSFEGQQLLKTIKKQQDTLRPHGKNHPTGDKIGNLCGSTANVVLITKDHYYIANSGDSRSVLYRSGYTIKLSNDHKPDDLPQIQRIKKAKGYVMNGRVNQILAVSRAFGDFKFKNNKQLTYDKQIITCQPEINVYGKSSRDQFIFIACDGVWENFHQSKILTDLVREDQDYKNERYQKTLEKLFDKCIAKNDKERLGMDNMTVIMIKPKNQNRKSEETRRSENSRKSEGNRISQKDNGKNVQQ